jgi:hypothetical protein
VCPAPLSTCCCARALASGLDYALIVDDIILDEAAGKAACCLDLNLKLAPVSTRIAIACRQLDLP